MRIWLCVFFCLIWHLMAMAQDLDEVTSVGQMLSGHSAYMLNENLEINIYGKNDGGSSSASNTGVYATPSYKFFRFRRDVTIQILNEKGLDLFSSIRLPESFDPSFVTHGPQVKNLGIFYSAYKIKEFKVEVKRKGKKPFSPKVKKKIRDIESFNLVYLYDYTQYEYSIEGLEVGDEVRIRYDLTIPFEQNYSRFASYRIFHHDSIPKLKYRLTVTHHESMDIAFHQYNGAKTKRHFLEDNTVTRVWEYENLPGCMKEDGARPYKELPHITWVIDYFKYYVHNSWKLENVPHYAIVASMRADKLPEIMTSIEIGSNTKEFASLIKSYQKCADTLGTDHEVISRLHQSIVEEFEYKNDREFYRRNDMRTERLSEFFENKTLRDLSRYNMYFALLSISEIPFYSVFIVDNRSGEISEEYFQPNFDNDYLLAVFFGERSIDLLLPKRGKAGWFYNEIPFYYENARSRLVHITDYAVRKSPIKENTRNIITQQNAPGLNFREQTFQVEVNLQQDSLYFSGEVLLSGQFSTMCRTSYTGGYKDPTVNKGYVRALWESIPESHAERMGSHTVSSAFPFEAHVDSRFISGNKVQQDGPNFILDLSQWFPHIRPKVNLERARYLEYYPDFLGSDAFRYTLQFDQPVKLDRSVQIEVSNGFADYRFSVIQENPKTLVVNSTYVIQSESVSRYSYDDVVEVAGAIKKANATKLKLGLPILPPR